jgi:hypothetical protein
LSSPGFGLAISATRARVDGMTTVLEVEKHALRLPEKQRARLAASILGSLAPIQADADAGQSEALRRAGELAAGTVTGLSQPELDRKIRARRRVR